MEKKLLPDDLFGPAPSKPLPIKPEPPKARQAVKKAVKADKPDRKPIVAKPTPQPKKSTIAPAPKRVPTMARRAVPPTQAKPAKKPAPATATQKTAPKRPQKTATPPQRKKAPAKKPEPAPEPARPFVQEAATASQTSESVDRRKIIEQFRLEREKGSTTPRKQAEKVEAPPGKRESPTAKTRHTSPLETLIEAEEARYEKCPLCNEPLPDNAHVCPHCYVTLIQCPYCGRRAGALENPKMATEQRFNRILKQFTLFSLAMPSLPIQPILDCSACKSRVIICESCHESLKHTAQACPSCGTTVSRTKLLINPLTILETILRRPDALRGLQRLIEVLLSSASK